MFCHVIETLDQGDLERLGDFVESIQAASQVSDAASRAHHLFLALHGIAVRYVGRHAVSSQVGQGNERNPEMDWFMSASGVPPSGQENGQENNDVAINCDGAAVARADGAVGNNNYVRLQQRLAAGPSLVRTGNEAELESWFWDNEDIMEMLR